MVAQTALALVLLIGSALLFRSFQKLRNVDPGYDTRDVFTFQIAPEGDHLHDPPSFARFHLGFMERLAHLPGVTSVGIVDHVPLNEGLDDGRFLPARAGGADRRRRGWAGPLAGDYFSTMGIRLLEGRTLTEADQLTDLGHVVINRSAANCSGREVAHRAPPQAGRGPRLGDRRRRGGRRDAGQLPRPGAAGGLLSARGPASADWVVSSPAYVVKTPRAETIAPEIRALVRELAPERADVPHLHHGGARRGDPAAAVVHHAHARHGPLLALILGTVGLYGVLSYIVAERTREIGVRMALGAEASQVRQMVVAQGARVIGIGVVVGVAVAMATTRALGSLLFGVHALDPRCSWACRPR